jgi:parallel beta-helix repeat protein
MRFRGTGWFWTTAAILAVAVVCLAPGWVRADWSYEYQDDFSEDKAETDSYIHSIFWPQGAYPPSQAYLYHSDEPPQHELGFGDYHGEPAYLGYRFPFGSSLPGKAVSGSLKIDVRLPDGGEVASGYLRYSFSPDGVNWSSPQGLEPGSHDISIESVRGTCYVIFFGTDVLVDNLNVTLYTSPATIHVPGDFNTIQEAIDAASDGDIVEVASGTYTGDGNRDIDFQGKAITVRSAAGAGSTTIDCGGHRGVYFHSGEGPGSVLRGFTITGGLVQGSQIPADNVRWSLSSTHPVGGGIFCEFSSPSIVDCVIEQCSAEVGGGIGCVGGTPTIVDCRIKECHAGGQGSAQSGGRGAGIGLIRGCDATIIDCTITQNVAFQDSLGAGVYCWQSNARLVGCDVSFNRAPGSLKGGGFYCGGSDSGLVLENCVSSNNTADAGAGLFSGSAEGSADDTTESVSVTNCTIAGNTLSGTQPASSTGGGVHSLTSDITIRNSIVWYNDGVPVQLVNPASNTPVLYCDVEGGYSGQGNIEDDPLFASVESADYHLESVFGRYEPSSDEWTIDASLSPCIDAGDPQDPVGAEPLPNGKRINMGTYGGTVQASKGNDPWVFHVDVVNGSDSNTGLSRADAFATIQKAVDEAYNGDTVLVWPGVYQEEVDLKGKAITIQSADDAAVIKAPNGFAFSFYTAESPRCVIRNFVITGCGEAAIYCSGASPTLTNLTISDNQFGISAYDGANPDISNCILWNNQNGDLYHCRARYCDIAQQSAADPTSGNISVDPLFADPANSDYHLQSRYGRYSPSQGKWLTDPVTSPCIDAGDPSASPGRERMPRGGRINMGAYGGTPFASLSGWPSWSDVNGMEQSGLAGNPLEIPVPKASSGFSAELEAGTRSHAG